LQLVTSTGRVKLDRQQQQEIWKYLVCVSVKAVWSLHGTPMRLCSRMTRTTTDKFISISRSPATAGDYALPPTKTWVTQDDLHKHTRQSNAVTSTNHLTRVRQ